MKTEENGPDCDWCGAEGIDLDVHEVAGDFLCDDCIAEKCDRRTVPAIQGTGVQAWEISPCLTHHDPHDCSSFVEAYETLSEAEECAYEGTGLIFWGVYAVMRPEYQSETIAPKLHIADFDSPRAAEEFVVAMNGRHDSCTR